MICLDFDWQIDEFMVYCRSTQLREKAMKSYEQTPRLFEHWRSEQTNITTADKITESTIRHYIQDLQERGKYSFYSNDSQEETNCPDRRRDFHKPIGTITITSSGRLRFGKNCGNIKIYRDYVLFCTSLRNHFFT